jgi:hypothetical protein
MKIPLNIEYATGEKVEVIASAPDIVKFEDKFNIAITKAGADMKLTYLLFLAHSALSRTKATNLTFEAWCDTVEGVGGSDTDPK